MGEKITYIYNSKAYTFEGERIFPKDLKKACGKWIYVGNFVDGNPHPGKVLPGKKYALMRIDFVSRLSTTHPQNRQYWDVADFEGDHLREVLGRDDAAQELMFKLSHGKEPGPGRYQIVEPVYARLVDRNGPDGEDVPYVELETLTAYERLELLEQCCCALEELYQCRAKKSAIISHRDFKVENLMLEIGSGKLCVRLIDFASICCEAGDGTMRTLYSQANTTPEAVGVGFVDVESTGYNTSKTTDVFALAGLLARLFGNCNPLRLWNQRFWPNDSDKTVAATDRAADSIRAAYERARVHETADAASPSWLETELGAGFKWNANATDEVKALLRKMIHIDPIDRLPLEDVHACVKEILDRFKQEGKATRSDSEVIYATAPEQKQSVYLVDRNELSGHLRSYTVAMKRAWAEGRPGETAYVRDYGTARNAAPTAEELRGRKISNCPNAATLCAQLAKIPTVEDGYSLLALTLRKMYEQGVFGEKFSGKIHIFTPNGEAACRSVSGYDLPAVANMLREQGAEIILHSDTPYTGDNPWYDRWDGLLQTTIAKTENVIRVVDDGGYVPPQNIRTEKGGLYIKRDGTKIYVAKKV